MVVSQRHSSLDSDPTTLNNRMGTGNGQDGLESSQGGIDVGALDDVPSLIARKINPRFANRLKNRLNRM